jgi:L-threonylcarbamoyladenylate synthase
VPPQDLLTTDVHRAADALRRGSLVAFATETVYGLGANALDPIAVARIFEAKGRPRFDPLIVHLPDAEHVSNVAAEYPDVARRLAERFWPGPLTLVLPKREVVPDLVTSGLPNVAVRVPGLPLARELIRLAGCPVAAPSANLFGRVSPTTAEHVLEQLAGRIDLVLDGGPCRVGVESTVLDVTTDVPVLLRPGGVAREELEALIGPVQVPQLATTTPLRPVAPGMLPQHYAPRTPVRIVSDWSDIPPDPAAAALALRSVPRPERFGHIELLSPRGDLREAAARFFATLRELDRRGPSIIWAELLPPHDLGAAVNDRLRRAAATVDSPHFPM